MSPVQPQPPKPWACPVCGGTESELLFTVVLGWECLACRAWRREHHTDPRHRTPKESSR